MKRQPCPFCGSKSELQAGRSKWVTCLNSRCGAEGPVRQTKAGAVAAWNYRPPAGAKGLARTVAK